MKRSEEGQILFLALLAAAIFILVIGGLLYKYHRDLIRYQLGPRSHLRIPTLNRRSNPLRTRELLSPPRLPNFEISGPLKGRPVLLKILPKYPLWAEEVGVEGKIRLSFKVNGDGNVASNIWVVQTIGRPEFDAVAVTALKHWKFAPVKYPESTDPASTGFITDMGHEQSGIINFHFKLANKPIAL